MPRIALCILGAAVLLFQLEPLVGRMVLPLFGAASSVWVISLFFFQAALLLGYFLAHVLSRCTGQQRRVAYSALCLFSLATLPLHLVRISSFDALPSLQLLIILTLSCGAVFCTLATVTPALQHLATASNDSSRSAFYLYAVSNIGACIGLLSYPFLIEPYVGLDQQRSAWSLGFFALVVLLLSIHSRSPDPRSQHSAATTDCPSTIQHKLLWMILSFVPNLLLIAATRHICDEVANIPLLWVLPLLLFLFSYVLAFGVPQLYIRQAALVLYGASLVVITLISAHLLNGTIALIIAAHLSALFFGAYFCNSELFLLRPENRHATSFYFSISLAGALAALFGSLIAPLLFRDYLEYPLSLQAVCIVAIALRFSADGFFARSSITRRAAYLALFLLCAGAVFLSRRFTTHSGEIARERNFYGVLRVLEQWDPLAQSLRRDLYHGSTLHGTQYLAHPQEPLAYYSHFSGIGRYFDATNSGSRTIGVIGLGVGTLAHYAKQGDRIIFYEIDPGVVAIAKKYFSFLSDSRAAIEIKVGDGRLLLTKEEQRQFDVLVVDAFNGGSIPVHLLTGEALRLYFDHLAPRGVLILHISNNFLDFEPVLSGLAKDLGLFAATLSSRMSAKVPFSQYVLLSREHVQLQEDSLLGPIRRCKTLRNWSDDYSNLWSVRRAATVSCPSVIMK